MVSESGCEGVGGEADVGFVRLVMLSLVQVTVAWYTTDFLRHWPRSGHSSGFLQLHSSFFGLSDFKRIDLLWPSMVCLMLGMQA